MDVGLRGALGLGALSLRQVVGLRRIVGMVAGAGVWRLSPDLGAGICFILWIWPRNRSRRWIWIRRGIRLHRVASDRAWRLFPSVVGRLRRPFWSGGHPQRQQFA